MIDGDCRPDTLSEGIPSSSCSSLSVCRGFLTSLMTAVVPQKGYAVRFRSKASTLFTFAACFLFGLSLVTVGGCGSPDGGSGPPVPSIVPAGETVSLSVPTMHCKDGCFAKIKAELEEQAGVAEVTLAEQAAEDRLDNRVVHVRTDASFDSGNAIAVLEELGFPKATVQR